MIDIELKISSNKIWSFFNYKSEKVWYAGDLCIIKKFSSKYKSLIR